MSLDLGSEGFAYNSVKVANTTVALGAITLATFNTGDEPAVATTLLLQLDNSGATPSADVSADLKDPSVLGVVSGTKLVLVNDTNGTKVTLIDPITGITFDFVNRIGEAITLIADGATDKWVMSF